MSTLSAMKRTNETPIEETAPPSPKKQKQENEETENEEPLKAPKKQQREDCPYLDTVNRHLLDFDFEKVCSVSLSATNVYACVVCGKYFQGRGRNSHAYLHSLQQNHHVFINLLSEKVYCLPDGYEVIDPSLSDIKRVLHPKFSPQMIAKLDVPPALTARTLDGKEYLPGVIGLNNLKYNDFINTIIQSLACTSMLRDFFLLPSNYEECKSELVHRFGLLIRKIWNPHNFKSQVSPHELMQEIALRSEKKFKIGSRGDPMDFLSWFMNTLHADLGGSRKPGSSIIHKCFQGVAKVTTIKEGDGKNRNASGTEKVKHTPFLYLTLDVPPPPLFKDGIENNIIPQEPLFTLLQKFNGINTQYFPTTKERKKYLISKLPKYLIINIKRFTKNIFFTEKNPTIVNFPLKNLVLKDYTTLPEDTKESTKYDLIANVRHEGKPGEGTYSVHILHKANQQWYNIQDLVVETAMPQLIALSEAYIQIYERQD